MEKRIKPWVNKKIVEYIGEDEPTLSDFICKKVTSHSTPSSILADISMVSPHFSQTFTFIQPGSFTILVALGQCMQAVCGTGSYCDFYIKSVMSDLYLQEIVQVPFLLARCLSTQQNCQ